MAAPMAPLSMRIGEGSGLRTAGGERNRCMETIDEVDQENSVDSEEEMPKEQVYAEYQRGHTCRDGVAHGGVVASGQGRPKNPTDQVDVQGCRRSIYRDGVAHGGVDSVEKLTSGNIGDPSAGTASPMAALTQ